MPWVRLTVGLALFAFLFSQIGLEEAASALSGANHAKVLTAIFLNGPTLGLATVRSSLILRRLGYSVPFDTLMASVIVGFVAGSLTPGASGELLRVQLLQARSGVPVHASVTQVAFERMLSFYLLCLTTVGAAAIAFLTWPLAALVCSALLVLVIAPAFSVRLTGLLPSFGGATHRLPARLTRFLSGVVAHGSVLLRDRVLLVETTITSIAIYAVVALQFWLLASAVGANLSLDAAWVAFGAAQAAGLISVLPFGIGVFDGSLTAVLATFGASASQGIAVALLVRLTISLPLLVVAAGAYAYLAFPSRAGSRGPLSSDEPEGTRNLT